MYVLQHVDTDNESLASVWLFADCDAAKNFFATIADYGDDNGGEGVVEWGGGQPYFDEDSRDHDARTLNEVWEWLERRGRWYAGNNRTWGLSHQDVIGECAEHLDDNVGTRG